MRQYKSLADKCNLKMRIWNNKTIFYLLIGALSAILHPIICFFFWFSQIKIFLWKWNAPTFAMLFHTTRRFDLLQITPSKKTDKVACLVIIIFKTENKSYFLDFSSFTRNVIHVIVSSAVLLASEDQGFTSTLHLALAIIRPLWFIFVSS